MIKIAIVDDHALMRAGLSQFLAEHVDLRVVAECCIAREALEAVRQEVADVMLLAIHTAAMGRRYTTPAVAERLAAAFLSGVDTVPHDRLSERKLQVFLRLAAGETVGEVALCMSLSVKTVSTYRSRVMEKMALVSNSDLTHYALKTGLIQCACGGLDLIGGCRDTPAINPARVAPEAEPADWSMRPARWA